MSSGELNIDSLLTFALFLIYLALLTLTPALSDTQIVSHYFFDVHTASPKFKKPRLKKRPGGLRPREAVFFVSH